LIIVEAFLLSLAIGLLRGGSLSNLARVDLRGLWLAYAPLVVQLALFLFEPVRYYLRDLVPYLHSLTYLFVFAFVFVNSRVPGTKLMGLGAVCNTLAITLNGGYMPASSTALAGAGMLPVLRALAAGPCNNTVLIVSGRTMVWFLGDVFFIPPPFPTPNVFSAGDVLIALGCFVFAQAALRAKPAG